MKADTILTMLRKTRKYLELKQVDVAEKCNMKLQKFTGIETGKRYAKLHDVEKIAKALGYELVLIKKEGE